MTEPEDLGEAVRAAKALDVKALREMEEDEERLRELLELIESLELFANIAEGALVSQQYPGQMAGKHKGVRHKLRLLKQKLTELEAKFRQEEKEKPELLSRISRVVRRVEEAVNELEGRWKISLE